LWWRWPRCRGHYWRARCRPAGASRRLGQSSVFLSFVNVRVALLAAASSLVWCSYPSPDFSSRLVRNDKDELSGVSGQPCFDLFVVAGEPGNVGADALERLLD